MRHLRKTTALISLLVLALTVGACNLQEQEDRLPTPTPTLALDTKPIVTILNPPNGAEHRVNTELLVTASIRDDIGVTRVQMAANGQPVKNIASESALGDREKNVIMNYTPVVTGDVTLTVTAFRNLIASDPATITVRVVSLQPSPTSGVIVTQGPVIDPNDPTCRAVPTVGLNMRSGPGTDFSVQTTLSSNTVVQVVGRIGDNSWYQVSYFSQIGWVSGSFVNLYGSNCTFVPIIASPPTPRPNVTATSNIPTATITPFPTITPTPGIPNLLITLFDGPEDVTIPGGSSSVIEEYFVTVSNQGTRWSGEFILRLRLRPGGDPVNVNIGTLRVGEAVVVSIDYEFDTTGSFILEVEVDPDNLISELSEADNKSQLSIIVD